MEDNRGFEFVQRKGKRTSVEVVEECMMLDENEIREQSNRLNCRKGTTDCVADLFRVDKVKRSFPKAFENYRPHTEIKKETPFTKIGNKNRVQSKIEFIDCSGAVQ